MTSTLKKVKQTVLTPFQEFTSGESASGLLLIAMALVAFVWANSPLAGGYVRLQETVVGVSAGGWGLAKPLILWVNDGLMAIFFFVVGLEIKRELKVGELSDKRSAALAVAGALGGMVVPALIYAGLNAGGEGLRGWGVPMATDIAFALGVLALLGNRVPPALKVFLTALAIVDDLGAVLVIAVFYTEGVDVAMLAAAAAVLAAAFAYGRISGRNTGVFAVLGVVLWYLVLKSGVHATVAGVLLAFAVPMRRSIGVDTIRGELARGLEKGTFEEHETAVNRLEDLLEGSQSPLHRIEHHLHPWVAFAIMPVFALFNAGVSLAGVSGFADPVTVGVVAGLVLGKPVGIVLLAWAAVALGVATLPAGVRWRHVVGAGLLGGIGFTMSLFIAALAFTGSPLLGAAKIGILAASVAAAVLGSLVLVRVR